MSEVPKRLYTIPEAAELLRRSVPGLRKMIWAGEIPIVRPAGGRKILIDVKDLEAFITENKSTYQ